MPFLLPNRVKTMVVSCLALRKLFQPPPLHIGEPKGEVLHAQNIDLPLDPLLSFQDVIVLAGKFQEGAGFFYDDYKSFAQLFDELEHFIGSGHDWWVFS